MVFSKSLLIKGLLGLVSVAGTVGIGAAIITGQTSKKTEEVDDLGFPKSCGLEEVNETTPKTCQLNEEQLKNLKFEPKEDSSISVDGLSENSTVELKVETSSDSTNYPKGKKYTLKVTDDKVTIKGVKDGDIVIEKGKDVVIRETKDGGKLEKFTETKKPSTDALGIPTNCTTSCDLTEEQFKALKFEPKTGSSITFEGLSGSNKFTLKVETSSDSTNYPKGKKYTLTSTKDKVTIKNTKDGEIVLEKDKGVVIRETSSGSKLEKFTETKKPSTDAMGIPTNCTASCDLTEEQFKALKFEPKSGSSITFEGLSGSNKFTLKVETSSDSTNYPKGKKYTLTSTTAKVTVKGAKDSDIVLEKDKGVVIRETSSGSKLEKFTETKKPEEVDGLGIPKSCNADKVTKSSQKQTCELAEEQLKKVKFKELGNTGPVTVSGLSAAPNNKITLTISWENNKGAYPGNKKYSLDNSKNKNDVKISGGGKDVIIAQQTESWFKNEGNKLVLVETKLDVQKKTKMKEVNEELTKLGFSLQLSIDDFNQKDRVDFKQINKTLTESDLKKIKFKVLNDNTPTEVQCSSTDSCEKSVDLVLYYTTDSRNFPKNMKFLFKNKNAKDSNKDVILKNGEKTIKIKATTNKWGSWFKNSNGKLEEVSS